MYLCYYVCIHLKDMKHKLHTHTRHKNNCNIPLKINSLENWNVVCLDVCVLILCFGYLRLTTKYLCALEDHKSWATSQFFKFWSLNQSKRCLGSKKFTLVDSRIKIINVYVDLTGAICIQNSKCPALTFIERRRVARDWF